MSLSIPSLAAPAAENPDVAATTYANVTQFRTRHVSLDLAVDFEHRKLAGTVVLDLQRLAPDAGPLVLDTRTLDVTAVDAAPARGQTRNDWVPVKFSLGSTDPVLGTPLTIELPAKAERVRVHYSTEPQAGGLQWLAPAQTAGGKQPFLFTQSEAIHARSWIPLQDTPSVRATYDARICTPKGLRAVMSAHQHEHPGKDGCWHFDMPQPIPSYLIALAVGDIGFRATGPRTGVYAEPALLDKAAYEFAETEKTIEIAEKTYGPYRWGRYDILVLPPSFPYGGMENPRLTFATPTVITGDRKLVSLVTHELAHSWSGNLVTNASWSDFWLNEGFTEYLTYRLTEAQFGKPMADMERVLGVADLKESIAHTDAVDHSLYRKTPAKDPDAVYSSVPYERGALFLSWLEDKFGRASFDAFLRGWFDDHAFQSATTKEFVAYLQDKLMAAHPGTITMDQVDAWVYQDALPDFAVMPHSDILAKVDAERADWVAGKIDTAALPVDHWSIQEWEQFLDNLPPGVSLDRIRSLDTQFKLTQTHNAILASSWFRQAIAHGDTEVYPAVEQYLCRVGRMYLITSIYRELIKTQEGRTFAEKVYDKARPGYHPITQQAVERVLNKESSAKT